MVRQNELTGAASVCINVDVYSSIVSQAKDFVFFFIRKRTKNITKIFVHKSEHSPPHLQARSFLLTPSTMSCSIFRSSSFDCCLILRTNTYKFFASQLFSYTFRLSSIQTFDWTSLRCIRRIIFMNKKWSIFLVQTFLYRFGIMSTWSKEIISILMILIDERKESFVDTLIEKGISTNNLFALLNIHMDDITIYTIIFGSSFFFFRNFISAIAAVESVE